LDLLTVSGGGSNRIFWINPGLNVTLSGLTIADGKTLIGSVGGGVFNDNGSLTISNCSLNGNSTASTGGGIYNNRGTLLVKNAILFNNRAGLGGGIYNNAGTLRVDSSRFDGNSAELECGGIFNKLGTLILNDCVITGNLVLRSPSFGGGLRNDEGFLTISNSVISSNQATFGGGICNYSGTLTVKRCSIEYNWAVHGGGVQLNAGTLTIAESALHGNLATGNGGGIDSDGRLAVVNCTFSSNSAAADGGGIRNNFNTLSVNNSTFSGNSAGRNGGGICNVGTSKKTIGHTLLARSASGSNVFNGGGIITNGGFNLSDDQSCANFFGPSDVVTLDAKLGPLTSHGGPTRTHALLPDSLAIDAGTNGLIAGVDFDQRGPQFQRIIGERVDIGAFEVQPAAPLRITSYEWRNSDAFEVRFTGSDGVIYRVEWSLDLGAWSNLGTANVVGPGQFEYLDTEITPPLRFYRVTTQ
jgi:hypothetical protein